MQLGDLFQTKECVLALEVFPPKQISNVAVLHRALAKMAELPIDYISVTCGAGGSGARGYTADIARHIKENFGIEPLAHLTCVGTTAAEAAEEFALLREAGIGNILALRGDRTPGAATTDFTHASDLMQAVSAEGGFYIAGACYPEGHPESASLAADIDTLKMKVQAGAGHLVSQLFFDNGKFFRFLNLARKKGVNCPIEAGVMPVVRTEQIERIVSLSSASLPSSFSKIVSRYAGDKEGFYEAGIDYAVRQIRDLVESGVDGIHLYAMNNADVARRVQEGVADLF